MITLLCLLIAACRHQWKWPAMWQWLLRVTWLVTVEWVLSVMPLVGQLVTQVLLRRLMQLMPLSALQWTEPPPKVARLVPMQVPHKQMTMGRVLQLKKL
jgi:hypothetical protein